VVIWTPRARADLKAIHDRIHKDAPINAKRVTQRILDQAADLEDFPGTHKGVAETVLHIRNFRDALKTVDSSLAGRVIILLRQYFETASNQLALQAIY
jgi:plasmid stabilization system protein ParE